MKLFFASSTRLIAVLPKTEVLIQKIEHSNAVGSQHGCLAYAGRLV